MGMHGFDPEPLEGLLPPPAPAKRFVLDLYPGAERIGVTEDDPQDGEFSRGHRCEIRWHTGRTTRVLSDRIKPASAETAGGVVSQRGYRVVPAWDWVVHLLAGRKVEGLRLSEMRGFFEREGGNAGA